MRLFFSWKTLGITFGVLGVIIITITIINVSFLAQLGADVPEEEKTAPGSGAFWDEIPGARVAKSQIDRAAEKADCEELNRLLELHSHNRADEDAVRQMLGYITTQKIEAGC